MPEIVVLGAAGMLGTDLVQELQARGIDVVGYNRLQCDITDLAQCRAVLRKANPNTVINCAAYTDVNRAESETDAAFAINATGAQNVALACAGAGARVIYVSTDYVFDGTKTEPYIEDDATAPINVYGASKLEGERLTAEACSSHCIVRTSWLYGRHGRNFVATMLHLARTGQHVKVVNDQLGSPTSTLVLARTLAHLVASSAQGIIHASCTGACTWYDFAREIFETSGIKPPSVSPVRTGDFSTPARRPANSRLASTRLHLFDTPTLPHWRDALHEYIHTLDLERCT